MAVAEPVVVLAITVLVRMAEALRSPRRVRTLPSPSRPATDTVELPVASPVTEVAVVE
jgi:hypothetical protein